MKQTRVAAFQSAYTENFDDAVSGLHRCLRWCDAAGVDIACFPECYLGGYFPNDRALAASVALELSGARFRSFLDASAGFRTAFVVGLTERFGPVLRNTAVVVQQGALVGTYAKTHPNEAFFEPGEAFPVFLLYGIRVGVNICNDANFPEAAAAVAERGAEVVLMPLNNRMRSAKADQWRPRHMQNLKARARETGCFVVSADIVDQGGPLVSHGCTAVVSPDGRIAAQAPEGKAGRAVYDLTVVARDAP